MIDKLQYALSRAAGTLDIFRGDLISKRIRQTYPLSAQIALLMDKEAKPDEFAAYQAFRESVKAEVDAELAELGMEVN